MEKLIFSNGEVSVNDVFASSWGYEQTNVSFYQVIALHGKKSVTVREISGEVVESDKYYNGKVKPRLNNFIGEPFKKQVNERGNRPALRIESFESAYLTNPDRALDFTTSY